MFVVLLGLANCDFGIVSCLGEAWYTIVDGQTHPTDLLRASPRDEFWGKLKGSLSVVPPLLPPPRKARTTAEALCHLRGFWFGYPPPTQEQQQLAFRDCLLWLFIRTSDRIGSDRRNNKCNWYSESFKVRRDLSVRSFISLSILTRLAYCIQLNLVNSFISHDERWSTVAIKELSNVERNCRQHAEAVSGGLFHLWLIVIREPMAPKRLIINMASFAPACGKAG